ncbi:OadG family protein [Desulfovirgula thermocuniculi]|uniref:OadG family protein n=1 Tax=Desulfovirgula thermocuniculi TaxID=348842 RepID=UPI000424E5B0|nr:OadG family protein [Desulfovirgula thermocuniculi]
MEWGNALAVAVSGIVSVFLALGILSAAVGLFSSAFAWASKKRAAATSCSLQGAPTRKPQP